jgi:hypothetical protein
MIRNPLGWHYPAGAEYDPCAPYNEKPQICANCGNDFSDCTCEEFELLDEDEAKWDYLADRADDIRKYGRDA